MFSFVFLLVCSVLVWFWSTLPISVFSSMYLNHLHVLLMLGLKSAIFILFVFLLIPPYLSSYISVGYLNIFSGFHIDLLIVSLNISL